MRYIHVDEGFRLRFKGRSEDFDQGVEIGIAVVLMDQGNLEFTRRVSKQNVEQVRSLADRMGYHIVDGDEDGEWVDLVFRSRAVRPKLRLVHTAG